MAPIRVAIIEDHDHFREGLSYVLNFTEGFACTGSFSSVEDALGAFPQADVVLLDIHLPGRSGSDSIPDVKRRAPGAFVIMLTVFDDDDNEPCFNSEYFSYLLFQCRSVFSNDLHELFFMNS